MLSNDLETCEENPCTDFGCEESCFVSNGSATCACGVGKTLSADGTTCEIPTSQASPSWNLYKDQTSRIFPYDSTLSPSLCLLKKFSGFTAGQRIFISDCSAVSDTHVKVIWEFNENGQIRSTGAGDADLCIGFRNPESTGRRDVILQSCLDQGVPRATTIWNYLDGKIYSGLNPEMCMYYWTEGTTVKVWKCFKNVWGAIE